MTTQQNDWRDLAWLSERARANWRHLEMACLGVMIGAVSATLLAVLVRYEWAGLLIAAALGGAMYCQRRSEVR